MSSCDDSPLERRERKIEQERSTKKGFQEVQGVSGNYLFPDATGKLHKHMCMGKHLDERFSIVEMYPSGILLPYIHPCDVGEDFINPRNSIVGEM